MAFRFLLLGVLCSHGFGPSIAVGQAPVTSSPSATSSNDETAVPGLRVLDLIALDKNGRAVTDLKPEELRLFENKGELKIKSLSPAARERLTIGLFFDISGSRRADKSIDEETRLASEFLHSVWREGDTAFVLAFSNEMHVAAQPSQKLEDVDEGLRKIPQATFWGPTALYDALCLVLKPEKLAGIPGRKVYVVFSDFEDNSSRNKAENVLDVARKGGVSIFPVILSEGFSGGYSKRIEKRSREQALKIADESGGEVPIPKSHKQLEQIFQRLTADLQSAYRIIYLPSTPSSQDKGKRGRLKLQTARAGVDILYAKD
jgi:VWFA-related protein